MDALKIFQIVEQIKSGEKSFVEGSLELIIIGLTAEDIKKLLD